MFWAPRLSAHERASAIWPTAAAAWLSSSLSAPAGSFNTVRPSAMAPDETTTTSHLARCRLAISAASESSQSRLRPPADPSTSSDEPTLITMRRKSLNDGVFDMIRRKSMDCAGLSTPFAAPSAREPRLWLAAPDDLDRHRRDAREPEGMRARRRQVDDPAPHEGPPVIDPHHHAAAV